MRRSFFAGLAIALVSQSIVSQAEAAPARLPFRSSFETGTFSEWNGGTTGRLVVTTEDASQGTHSVRGTVIAGTGADQYKDFYFGNHPTVGGEAVSVDRGLWLSFDSKFDNGFVFGSNPVHKIMLVNFDDENARRRYQIIVNIWTPTGEYFLEHVVWNADRSFNKTIPGIDQNVPPDAIMRRGVWEHIKLFIKPNTPGQSNGIVRMWVNGALKTDRTSVAVRENTNFLPNKLIVGNYVTDLVTNGTQRWDNVVLSDVDPDGVRPSAPTNTTAQ
ncbi:MAG TPA: heparin lyase I family protein [Steroidobacteraceae bacterium]